MKVSKKIDGIAAVVLFLLGITFIGILLEYYSIQPVFRNEPATITQVQYDPAPVRGAWEAYVTHVTFEDGVKGHSRGLYGNKGDIVQFPRFQRTESLLGIAGDTRIQHPN